MEKQIEFIAIPCGHTFCNLCSVGLQECHTCRAPISNFNKILFSILYLLILYLLILLYLYIIFVYNILYKVYINIKN